MERNQLVLESIEAHLPGAVEEVNEFRDELTLVVASENVVQVCRLLHSDQALNYNFLSDICADDLLPEFPRFAISYHLYSIPHNHRLRLRVYAEDPEKGPPTMAGVWPIATWLEMEVWDLMGIRFAGNNDLRRLFLPEDWQGYPLRKDYPLGYEEVQFSFNWREVATRKPFPQE